MKKIKITEQQANMLKDLGKTKVLKITQEQYNRIIELERLNEMDLSSPITRGFHSNMSKEARKDFQKTKIPGITEMYKAFINEVYGLTESDPLLGESRFKKLAKLMEACGMINHNRIVKEKFGGDKNKVKEIISLGLQKMHESGSVYSAMEIMEEALDLSKDMPAENIFKSKVKEFLEKNYNNARHDGIINYIKRKYDNGDYKEAWLTINRTKNITEVGDYPMGAANDPRAPYNQEDNMSEPTTPQNVIYDVIWNDNENAIMTKDGELYIFNIDAFDRDDYAEYAERETSTDYDEDGPYTLYSDEFEVDGDVIERYVNDNLGLLSTGIGILDYEDGYNIVKFDEELKRMFNNELNQLNFNETTTASSSGAFVGKMNDTSNNQSNVSDELITDEVSYDKNTFLSVINNLSSIINTPQLDPNQIINNQSELVDYAREMANYDDTEDNEINRKFPLTSRKIPFMINKLIEKAEESLFGGITQDYIDYINGVYAFLNHVKRNSTQDNEITEQGIGSVGAYDTPGFASSEFMGTKGKSGKAPVKTSVKPYMKGAQEVKVKEKCKKYPYCDQGPDAIEI